MRSETHPTLFGRTRTDGLALGLPADNALAQAQIPVRPADDEPAGSTRNPESASIGLGLSSSFSAPGDGPR